MFVASKFEDIYPLKMKTIYEKIAHKKLEMEVVKTIELDIMKVIQYQIHAPTVLDFLKVYLVEVLGIQIKNRSITKKKEEEALFISTALAAAAKEGKEAPSNTPENVQMAQNYLIEKMSIYLSKMSMHDADLATRHPSLLAVGAIYVALKICEQLKKKELISANVVTALIQTSQMQEDQILDVS